MMDNGITRLTLPCKGAFQAAAPGRKPGIARKRIPPSRSLLCRKPMTGSPIAAFSHITFILSHFTQRCKCFLVMQQGEIVRIRCCLNPSGDDAAQKPWDFRSSRLNAHANVGADSIRPKLMELSGAVNGVSLDAVPHNRVPAKIWGCGRMLSTSTAWRAVSLPGGSGHRCMGTGVAASLAVHRISI